MKNLDYTNRTVDNSSYDEWYNSFIQYMFVLFKTELTEDSKNWYYDAYTENYELGDTPKEALHISLNHAI